jgi:hypothetical protein
MQRTAAHAREMHLCHQLHARDKTKASTDALAACEKAAIVRRVDAFTYAAGARLQLRRRPRGHQPLSVRGGVAERHAGVHTTS